MSRPVYRPFATGQWQLSLGLKPLQIQDWLEIDEQLADYLNRKSQLLEQCYSEVFAALPNTEANQQAVLDLVVNHLLQYFPHHFKLQKHQIHNQVTGQIWNPADFTTAPLDLAGRLIQEDLCLMTPSASGYSLCAASLCFPLHWRLQYKLGLGLASIHEPVPNYDKTLEHPVNNYFEHITVQNPGYRMNWSIVNTPELFLGHTRNCYIHDGNLAVNEVGQKLWLRVERQTLRRLQSGDVLFTIRTYVDPLSTLEADPRMAANMASAIEQIPSAMQLYKRILPIRDVLLSYLNQISKLA
jgi:hypothetical protein